MVSEELFAIKHIEDYLLPDVKIFGNKLSTFNRLKPFHEPQNKSITYITDKKLKNIDEFLTHLSSVFITNVDASSIDKDLVAHSKAVIFTNNPRLQMAKITSFFKRLKKEISPSIHPSAIIGNNVVIGAGTTIDANVIIYDDVKIGSNCRIMSGSVIGSDGFGYEKDSDGTWFKIEHLGSVVIGNNVDIGSNTCIDRGTLGNTIIGDNVKIDNLVHIAHNTTVNNGSMIIANAMVAGSCVIGENVWIAPSSSIREGVIIGDGSLVGMGSVVTKNVDKNVIVMGVPAKVKNDV
jgi:UDP-3-O-[3-hydroxymyristoyl] glucosamine N-acyltransferase